MGRYTFSDLMGRYDMKKSALSRFLSRHLNEINRNGEHAVKTTTGWSFDDSAIQVLDRLRKFGTIDATATNNAEYVNELKDIVSELRKRIIALQDENSDLKSQLIDAVKVQVELNKQLAGVSIQLLQLQQRKGDAVELENENVVLKNRISELEDKVYTVETENTNLHDKIDTFEKNQSKPSPVRNQHVTKYTTAWNRRGISRRIQIAKIKK